MIPFMLHLHTFTTQHLPCLVSPSSCRCLHFAIKPPTTRPWDALLAPVLVRHPENAFGVTSKAAKRPAMPKVVHIIAHTCAHHCPHFCTSMPTTRPWDALLAPVLVRHPGNAFGIFSTQLRGQLCPQVYAYLNVFLSAHHSSLLISPTLAITTKSLYLITPHIDQACITRLRLPYTTFGSAKEVPGLSSNMSFKEQIFQIATEAIFCNLESGLLHYLKLRRVSAQAKATYILTAHLRNMPS